MRTKATTVNSIEVGRLIRLGALLRHLPSLVLIVMIVTLGLVFSTAKVDGQFLQPSDSKPFTITLPHSENIIHGNYAISENDDFNFAHSKKILERFFTVIPKLLTTILIRPYEGSLCDAIDSSPYIKSFASIPLRSPPLFS